LQLKPCHTKPCVNNTISVLTCASKLDVILVLDGSGSLGQTGWDATIKAGASISRAMGPDVRLAALLFSGHTTYQALWLCTGVIAGTPNMKDDCGIEWVDHFTTDAEAVAQNIERLNFPGKTTLTSLALSTAETELSNGRSDAQSIVIVITDGKPMSEHRTGLAAKSLKQKARVIWVPVGRYISKKNVKKWASFPPKENIVKVNKFGDLAQPKVLNEILTDACPVVSS